MKELVIASNNHNKIREIKTILAPYHIDVYSLNDLKIDIEPEETGTTFQENAYIKAKAIYDYIKKPVLSDDSGLEVIALDNAPGVYTARYAGPQRDDNDNIDLLLKNMEGIADRRARFVGAMCLIVDEDHIYEVEEYWHGEILHERLGTKGFGYNPIFYVPELEMSVGQMDDEVKNVYSHRAKALHKIIDIIEGGV